MEGDVILLEQMSVYTQAAAIADKIWNIIIEWQYFEKKTIGDQLVRATDSIGANIAEGYGRFHYGDKIKFYYYARGSVFETQFWIKRSMKRKILDQDTGIQTLLTLKEINKQLNFLIKNSKIQQKKEKKD